MLVLSLKTEPSGGSCRRNGGLQTPYNGIALLEFQGFAQKFNASKKMIHPDNPWCFAPRPIRPSTSPASDCHLGHGVAVNDAKFRITWLICARSSLHGANVRLEKGG
jgi:hypothetical protein